MHTALSASRAYLYSVGMSADTGKLKGRALSRDCAGVILYTAEKATWMALQSIQALGT